MLGILLLTVVGGVIGGIWGWYDPANYFGDFRPALSSGLGALGGALLSGWVFPKEAEGADLPPWMLLTAGLFTAAVVTATMIAAGCSLIESTFGTYLGYLGGIGFLVNPTGSFVGAIVGIGIWSLDYIEWTARSERPAPEAFGAVFSWGLPRFLSLLFLYSCFGAAVWPQSKK
jgi:hypothetical protein